MNNELVECDILYSRYQDMLKSFQIKNFKLFQSLEIERLARVNLIVGKNNVGKSAFIEALALYIRNASPWTILGILTNRQEIWASEGILDSQTDIGNYIRHLYFNHRLPSVGEEGIVIGDYFSDDMIHLAVADYQNARDEKGMHRMYYITPDIESPEELSNVERFLVAKHDGGIRRLIKLDANIDGSIYRHAQMKPDRNKLEIVPTQGVTNNLLVDHWNLIVLTLGNEVINILKLINPKISGIAFVKDISDSRNLPNGHNNKDYIPLVKLEGRDEPLSLKNMGDGMTRLFQIVLCLVNAKDGTLLIDEFENGLYWGIQPKIWEIIFDLAERLNVQVFATTHSRDCVEGFNFAWNKNPSLGAFFRLTAKNDNVKATEYTLELLNDSIDVDVEVR